MDDALGVQLLGGDHGKAICEVEPHLPAKDRAGARAGAVSLLRAMREHMAHEVQVSLHPSIKPEATVEKPAST